MRRFFFGLAVFALAAPLPLLADSTDRQIAQQIVKQLTKQKESGELKGFNLDLQVEDGAVYLKGFVSEREQRRKAVDVARKVEGVKQVFNEIEIKSAESVAAKPLKKSTLAEKPEFKLAKTQLVAPPEPPQVAVEVMQEDEEPAAGTEARAEGQGLGGLLQAVITEAAPPVALPMKAVPTEAVQSEALPAGEAASQTAQTEAAEPQTPVNVFRTPQPAQNAFRALQPVQVSREQAIETNRVAPGPSARQITEAIVNQYRIAMEHGELKGFGIDVQVDQGVVTLQGTVADPGQLDYAIDVASNVQGVKKIINALDVTHDHLDVAHDHEAQQVSHDGLDEGVQHAFRQESSQRPVDGDAERIAKEVVAGLQQQKAEGLLSNFGIDVQVDQRVVWMSGYVKDAEQHARALDVARYVPGVEKVVNDLKVQPQRMPFRPANATLPQGMTAQQAMGQQMPNYQMVPIQYVPVQAMQASNQTPMAFAPARPVNYATMQPGQPVPMTGNAGVGIAPARFDQPQMPGYAWPSYAPSPNYGAVTYPKQYSPSAWPYIGPFYPYPQVPLGWRRVTLEWDDGWWNLKFKNTRMH